MQVRLLVELEVRFDDQHEGDGALVRLIDMCELFDIVVGRPERHDYPSKNSAPLDKTNSYHIKIWKNCALSETTKWLHTIECFASVNGFDVYGFSAC